MPDVQEEESAGERLQRLEREVARLHLLVEELAALVLANKNQADARHRSVMDELHRLKGIH